MEKRSNDHEIKVEAKKSYTAEESKQRSSSEYAANTIGRWNARQTSKTAENAG